VAEETVKRHEPQHSVARTVAALVGTFPLALGAGVALTSILPISLNERLLLGTYSVFPIWVAAACWAFLAPSGRRAWLDLFAAFAVLTLLAFIGLAIRSGMGTGP